MAEPTGATQTTVVRVLLVEDDTAAARFIGKALLRDSGFMFDLVHATSLSSGLERLVAGGIDVVLLDLGLPESSGAETFRRVHSCAPSTPIVVLTGTDDAVLGQAVVTAGAQDYLIKGQVDSRLLPRCLRYAIERKRAEVELVEYRRHLEALVNERTAALAHETAERSAALARAERLNAMLRAIRQASRCIIGAEDEDALLRAACNGVVAADGYSSCWIALLNPNGAVTALAEAGIGAPFALLSERLRRGDLPFCARRALDVPDVVVLDSLRAACRDCPLADAYREAVALSVRLEHAGEVLGVMSVSVPPEFHRDGELQGLLSQVAGDVAFALHGLAVQRRRERAEDALRRSELNLRSAMNGSADGMVVLDKGGAALFVNCAAEELLAQPAAALLGQHLGLPLVGDRCVEIDIARPGSAHHVAEMRVAPIEWEGTPAYLASLRDITSRRLLEQQLRQSQKLESIGTLAGGVAHEINNPINGIMNYAQLIMDDPAGRNEKIHTFAAEIVHETERVATLVKDLLRFARQDKEQHSPANAGDVIEGTLSLIRAVMRRDQITVAIDIPEDLPKIKCRSQQIQQVIMNLLTNARDALNEKYEGYHEDKQILISARVIGDRSTTAAGRQRDAGIPAPESGPDPLTGEPSSTDNRSPFAALRPPSPGLRPPGSGPHLRLTIEDHGTGIPAAVQERMFDPFYTTKPKDKGTGLGLSISHGIVMDHHGQLSVETELGVFTRFHIDLPVDNGWELAGEG